MVEKKESLSKVLAGLEKKYNTRIGGMEDVAKDISACSCGNIALDAVTGVGGLPYGRLIELYGPPSSGKTTLAIQTAVQCQRAGGRVAYIDHEYAMDKVYAKQLGLSLDPDKLIFTQPDFLDQGAEIGKTLAATGEVQIIIFDSVAAMTPEKLAEADIGKGQIALQARLMSQFLSAYVPILANSGCMAVFLNHIAEVIDTSPMGQQMAARGIKRYTTPGGRALKFYASLRMEFKQIGGVKEEMYDGVTNSEVKSMTGTNTRVLVTKNKVAPPFGVAEVQVRFGRGFSQEYSVLKILLAHNVIRKTQGGIYHIPLDLSINPNNLTGAGYIKGEENVLHALEKDSMFFDFAYRKAKEVAETTKLLVPREQLDVADEDLDETDPELEALIS